MPIRKMLFLSGALTAIVATVLPLKVVAGADGLLRVTLSSLAAQEGNGNGGGGNGGNGGENGNGGSGGNGNGSGNGSDNAGGGSGDNGNGSSNGNSGGNGNGGAGASTGTGTGTGVGAGSAPTGPTTTPRSATAAPARPSVPAAPAPVAPSKAGVEVDVRGTSITVRHHNGATERISQGRYEMRDSRSRTIVNRTATPSDTSRLRSFGR
ncbi:hypothetical protein [Neorhizobium galegae]|uniref:Glycine-rich cell wall protein n=1 Tax=Neorhizobium galegae bv. officinalis TaxID=323656 RepID=A0A0T7H511_NEOGA|nr:hypothetical protein [Neorhizobium galegae]CDZ54527.1 Hypothetical protein NGAL_HAMBI1189_55550 [Neorhizobium galegae bv. officinalis]